MNEEKYDSILKKCYIKLDDTDIPYKYLMKLKPAGIETIGDLLLEGQRGLLNIDGVGSRTVFILNKEF